MSCNIYWEVNNKTIVAEMDSEATEEAISCVWRQAKVTWAVVFKGLLTSPLGSSVPSQRRSQLVSSAPSLSLTPLESESTESAPNPSKRSKHKFQCPFDSFIAKSDSWSGFFKVRITVHPLLSPLESLVARYQSRSTKSSATFGGSGGMLSWNDQH